MGGGVPAKRYGLLFIASVPMLLPGLAAAQPAPPPLVPRVIEREAPQTPPALAPRLQAPAPVPQRGANDQATLRIDSVRIAGNAALPDATLMAPLRPLIGQEVPLAAIEDARIALIAAYGRAGYPFVSVSAGLSRTAAGTELLMAVVEGRIAAVRLDGDIGPAGVQVLRFLERLVDGQPVSAPALERALLLAGDVPGVTARGLVRPLEGGAAGELELVAQVSRRAFQGYVAVDNRGYRLTGPVQALASVSGNSFTSFGERTDAALFLAEDGEQVFGQVAVEAFLGGSGLRLRAYAGLGQSRPGGALDAAGYRGETLTLGLGASYPIIRSRPLNLAATAALEAIASDVELGVPVRALSNRDEVRAVRIGLEGSARDVLLGFAPGAAVNSGSIRVHRGGTWFGGGAGGPNGAQRAGSEFEFTKLTAEATRIQPLAVLGDGWLLGLTATIAGQVSDDVLPSAEKFYLGGTRLGRGFYAGQVTGDSALATSLELTLDTRLPGFSLGGGAGALEVEPSAQFYLFHDHGRSYESRSADPDRRVESFGGGVRLGLTEYLQLDIEGVHRLTRRVDGAGVAPLSENAVFWRVLTRF